MYIDAHKPEYSDYVDRSQVLLRQGGAIVIDKVLQRGSVFDPHGDWTWSYKESIAEVFTTRNLSRRSPELQLAGLFDLCVLYKDFYLTIFLWINL